MSLHYEVAYREGYAVARADGEPDLGEFIRMVQDLGAQSRNWPRDRLLVDLRGVRTMRSFTEHYAIGEEVGRQLGHLRKVASLVPADRITRASEKTARRAGVNLTVFTDEAQALAWLLSDAVG